MLDVEKPRDIKTVDTALVPFEMGSVIKVNNVTGAPLVSIGGANTNVVKLYNNRRTSNSSINGLEIGEARVYSWAVSDAPYTGDTTDWDLHLYDIQTFTILKCSAFTVGDVDQGARIRGLASGAIGYAAKNAGTTGVNEIALSSLQNVSLYFSKFLSLLSQLNLFYFLSVLKLL